jgi:uncharacterized protein (TIGR03067 family)
MLRATALLLAAGLIAAADATKDSKTGDIEGTWQATSGIDHGKKIPAAKAKTLSITFKGGKYTVKVGSRAVENGTYKADASKTPAEIERTAGNGPDKGKTSLGIYEVKGDALKTAFEDAGKPRPTAFDGQKAELTEFTRSKK